MAARCTAVELHHEVLIPWAAWRKECSPLRLPDVIVLDHHTDVLPAFRDASHPVGNWREAGEAVPQLRHDEHLDWAVRSGLVGRCRIVSFVDATPPASPALTVCCDERFPEENELLNHPETYRALADGVLESPFLEKNVGEIPEYYLQDVDCDYFMTEAALHPRDGRFFRELWRRAQFVTLSRESDWVRLLRMPGETLTGASAAASLMKEYASSGMTD